MDAVREAEPHDTVVRAVEVRAVIVRPAEPIAVAMEAVVVVMKQ